MITDAEIVEETNPDSTAISLRDERRNVPSHSAKRSLFDMEPAEQIAKATEIANVLNDVIEKQKLFSNIQGKKYVKVEGWQLCGSLTGVLPREVKVVMLADGSFEATVDLVRATDGCVIGGASALCGVDEKRWAGADQYARRSMAITRAVGKAYRNIFGWVISLAGYETTTAEEIPTDSVGFDLKKLEPRSRPYVGETAQQEAIKEILKKKGVPEEKWDTVHVRMMGKFGKDLNKVIEGVM